ncbi:hypothetical protein C8E87_6074 [Paractinoplanes brasiliensis]|uniref:Uncharacterized protein n=1 Tax=Paractinoplanes brasiliensis TaxID=52695 RepID=A0A4R6K0N5_9ACTN|nr:hypothetical protein C8E87_6074 [Actinoplanes brasiliensis]
MTSFPAQARCVRDAQIPVQRRLYALRECALHCSPYGFRATWHHLVVFAGIPRHLDTDPESLVRAVLELEQARQVVLPRAAAYARQRRQEKSAGLRVPRSVVPWNSWGWSGIAYCPDPVHHPTGPLAAVVRRVLDGFASGEDAVCRACGTERRRPGRPCPTCGVHPDGPSSRWRTAHAAETWYRIWRRDLPAGFAREGQ